MTQQFSFLGRVFGWKYLAGGSLDHLGLGCLGMSMGTGKAGAMVDPLRTSRSSALLRR